jgi:hypothetical protein
MKKYFGFIAVLAILASCTNQSETVTVADYQRAEKFLAVNTAPLVTGTISGQSWLNEDQLFYKRTTAEGWEFVIADLKSQEKKPAFNHSKMANALTSMAIKDVKTTNLNLSQVSLSADGQTLTFNVESKRFSLNLTSYEIKKAESRKRSDHLSPNGKLAAFIKDFNLWVRDTETGKTTQVTFDGAKDYGYATNNAGWVKSDVPVLLWSPNSDKIFTFRHDGRGVGEMYLYNTQVGHSKLEQWKYPLPGDSLIFMIERCVINLGTKPSLVKLKMAPDAHRGTTTDHIAEGDGTLMDAEWSDDGSQISFVSSTRDHKSATLRVANPTTGDVRTVMNETVATYFESGANKVNWHVLKESNEAIWFSERDNWGHLYLYDLNTGEVKNQITKGNWRVLQVLHIDKTNRMIYFTGSNKEEGDPYFQYLYVIGFDGTNLKNLTPENANHQVNFSNSKNPKSGWRSSC